MKFLSRYLLMIFVIITILPTRGQQKTDAMLFGDVKSKATGEHIPYASVQIKGEPVGTISDATGHFKLVHLPIGTLLIEARATGYKPMVMEVIMEPGKALTVFFKLETDIIHLGQMVVTATRTEHAVRDVPVKTALITGEEIRNKNASNLYEALEGTPGIRVENQCQSCNFTMVRMQGLGPEHTQILINGQPMFSGLAGVYGLQQLSTIDINRIEVVKGAGSALYGSNAVAGAINIITNEPSFVPVTTVDVQFGNHRTNRYDVSSSMRNEKGNMGLSVFARRLAEGVIDATGEGLTRKEVNKPDGISDRVSTNLTNAGFSLFIHNVFAKDDKLVIKGRTIFEKREGGVITDDYFRNPFTEGTEYIVTDRYETELNYSKTIGKHLDLQFNTGFVSHQRSATNDSYLSDYMSLHHDTLPDLRNMRPYLANEKTLTSTLTLGRKVGAHHLLIGLQGYYDHLEESGMYVVVDPLSAFAGVSYRSTGLKMGREAGIFLQDEWAVNPRLTIVPGFRVDHHFSGETYSTDKVVFDTDQFPATRFDQTSFNPRIAIKYALNKKLTLRANTGTGFRAPYGFSEDLHLCSGSPRVWKSSDLQPEKSVSYNLSLDYYSNNTNLNINLFRTDLYNKIDFTQADSEVAALGYDYQWKNIDNAYVQGVELSLKTSLGKWWQTTIDITGNQGKYDHQRKDWAETPYAEISRHIPRFPAVTGNATLAFDRHHWNIALTGSYQGVMYIDYFNEAIDPDLGDLSRIKKTDPFMLFNARASKTINQWTLYTGVKNMFNYIQDERKLDDAAFLYAPVYGRLFYAGIRLTIR